MKTRLTPKFHALFNRILLAAAAVSALASLCFAPSALAASNYFGTNNVAGTSYSDTGTYWGTSGATETGGTAFSASAFMVVGNNASDFAAVNNFATGPYAYTIGVSDGSSYSGGGIFIGATNVAVTFNGSANTHWTAAVILTVTNWSTEIWNDTRQAFDASSQVKGFNWNNEVTTLSGPGTFDWQTPFGCNSGATITNNGPTCDLDVSTVITSPATDIGTARGNFVMAAGLLNFQAAGSCDVFYGLTNGRVFQINGGSIDNNSGAPITLLWTGGTGVGFGSIKLNGNFTFLGSTNLSMGTALVTNTVTPIITVNSNELTFGGAMYGNPAANGLTLSGGVIGSGVLALNGANAYTGATTINGGTLLVGGSLNAGSAVSIGAGGLGGSGSVGGSVTTTSASAQINQETNYLETAAVGTLALGSSLNMSSGGTVYMDLGIFHNSGNDLITVAGALTLGTGTVFHIHALSGSANLDAAGDYILIQGSSPPTGTVNPTPVFDGTAPGNASFYVVEIVGNNVVLHFNVGNNFAITAASATPSSLTRYQTTMCSVTVTNGTPPYTVSVNTSAVNGPGTLNLVQDNNEPAGLIVFTNSFMPGNQTAAGSYILPVSANDSASHSFNADIFLTLNGASLVWAGDNSGNSTWDTGSDQEWQGGLNFAQGDAVRFDDSAPANQNVTNVQINVGGGNFVMPSTMVVSNTASLRTAIYTFPNYSGGIGGTNGVLKQGSGTLVLDENNTYTGQTVISNGTVQVGLGDGNGSLGYGSVVNNGSMVFDHPGNANNNAQDVTNNISGTGGVTEEGVDTLNLSGANSYGGNVLVESNSVLQLGSSTALGLNTVTTITPGSALDLGGHAALNANSVVVSGAGNVSAMLGAIDNTSSNIFPALTNVTLVGNTTFGANGNNSASTTLGRWDLRSPGSTGGNPGTAFLNTGGNPYNLTKVGSGQISIVSVTVDPALANIDIQNGMLGFEGNTTGEGNPADTITIEGTLFNGGTSVGTLEIYQATNQFNKNITLNDGGTIYSQSGTNTIVGTINVDFSSSSSPGDCFVRVSGGSLNIASALTGNGVLYQTIGTNLLILSGNTTAFSGGVEVHNGKLTISNVLDATEGVTVDTVASGTPNMLTVAGTTGTGGVTNNGVLAGSGTITASGGRTALDNYGTVYPSNGGTPATLSVTGNAIFESGCTADFTLNNATTIGGGVNDLIAVSGAVNFPGGVTININPAGLLQLSPATYTLMTYSSCNLPVGTVSGFTVNGILNYTFTLNNTGTALQLTATGGPGVWNGGSATDSNWSDTANWNGVNVNANSGNQSLYFGGNNRVNNTDDVGAGNIYYTLNFLPGAGVFTLNATSGNFINLGSNILNQSSSAQTINIPIGLNSSITNGVFSAGPAGLTLAGNITNTSTTQYNIHLQGTNGVISGGLQTVGTGVQSLGLVEDLATGGSNSWSITGNGTYTLTNLTVAGGGMTIGTGSDSPTIALTNETAQPLVIGGTTNTTASLTINSGTFSANYTNEQPLEMGASGSLGILNINGGAVSLFGKFIQIGDTGGTGIVNVAGGTLYANAAGGDFILGNAVNATGFLNVSGGTVTIPTNAYVGFRGPGTWTISGSGTVLVPTTLNMNRNNADSDGSVGTVSLNAGGTLLMNSEVMGNAGTPQTGAFNLNGGVLEAGANTTSFMSPAPAGNTFTATVQAGGAIINDEGFAITNAAPLVHDSTLGATPDGGFTKRGAGSLTLAAINTYTGNTIVSAGTLALNGTGSIATSPKIIVAGGATFDVSGLTAAFTLASGQVLSNSSSTVTINCGTIGASTGSGTLSLTYASGTPSLNIGSGTLTVPSTTTVNINNTGAQLPVGAYTIASVSGTGAVASGMLPSVTVSGNGVAAGQPVSLQISGGALQLVVGSLAKPAVFTGISINGPTLTISATNGADNGSFRLVETTNLLLPISQWTPELTNNFNASGNLVNFSTNIVTPNGPQEFYLLLMP